MALIILYEVFSSLDHDGTYVVHNITGQDQNGQKPIHWDKRSKPPGRFVAGLYYKVRVNSQERALN